MRARFVDLLCDSVSYSRVLQTTARGPNPACEAILPGP